MLLVGLQVFLGSASIPIHFGLTCLGNDASQSRMDILISKNNEDNSSQTCPQASLFYVSSRIRLSSWITLHDIKLTVKTNQYLSWEWTAYFFLSLWSKQYCVLNIRIALILHWTRSHPEMTKVYRKICTAYRQILQHFKLKHEHPQTPVLSRGVCKFGLRSHKG